MILSAPLPYFIDAIMKLLDPSFLEIRSNLLPLSSKFLFACFRTFPFIDYHSDKQKYAVASDKGPIVIYDLKTGTKNNVLESLSSRASVISLSPDVTHICALTNRSPITNTSKEMIHRSVCVWKLSSNILSLFATSSSKPCMAYAFGSESSKTVSNPETLRLLSKDDRFTRPSFSWQNTSSFTLALKNSDERNVGIQFHI